MQCSDTVQPGEEYTATVREIRIQIWSAGRVFFAQLRNGKVVAGGNGERSGDISGIRRELEQGTVGGIN